MAITDLTGYTWVGNDIVSVTLNGDYSLNFVYNNINKNYIHFEYSHGKPPIYDIIDYNNTRAYYYEMGTSLDGWSSEACKTIHITGGDDATNPTLIGWLEANGTLIPPTPTPIKLSKFRINGQVLGKTNNTYLKDITMGETTVHVLKPGEGQPVGGEIWIINEVPNIPDTGWENLYYDIRFISNNTQYIKFGFSKDNTESMIKYRYNTDDGPNIVYYNFIGTGDWTNQAYRTVIFLEPPTGDLLTWLQANAVKQ